MDQHVILMAEQFGMSAAPMASQLFGNAGKEHMQKYGTCVSISACTCVCVLVGGWYIAC